MPSNRSRGFPGGSIGKESACNMGDLDSIPGLGRFPGEGNGNPLQYSCLKNPMNRGAWQATIYGVAQSWTLLSVSEHPCTNAILSFFLPSTFGALSVGS